MKKIKNKLRKIFRKNLNIKKKSNDRRGRILSNLAETPFCYGGFSFTSVEAALQGIKFETLEKQKKVFQMSAKAALEEGRKVTESIDSKKDNFIYWYGNMCNGEKSVKNIPEKIVYNSPEHRLLLASFIREKIHQNREVQKALLETDNLFIYHHVGEESKNTSLPEKFYVEILLAERKILKSLFKIF